MVEVKELQTFDNLDNPKPEGLHDKKMGVSPFDKTGSCPTCGMTSNFCAGHHGHIELIAPIYNPFMIKDMYRLMKSKCFACNKLRINGTKISTFTQALKLIKAGDIFLSQRLKAYCFSMAKDLLNADTDDIKKIGKITMMINRMVGKDNRVSNETVKE